MSVCIQGKLDFDLLSTTMTHPSGAQIRTTAPTDNGGDGSLFSPTDLCAASLGACIATTIGLYAKKHSLSLKNVSYSVEKNMSQTAPRRIAILNVYVKVYSSCSNEEFERMVHAAKQCPVKKSLSPETHVVEEYEHVKA